MPTKTKQPEQEQMANAVWLPRDRIRIDPNQPRKFFDPAEMEDLSKSIKEHGLLQPVTVRYDPSRYDATPYLLAAGERRFRASEGILEKLPCIISDVDIKAARVLSLVENIHRKDLTALEEAHAIAELMTDQKLSGVAAGRKLGKSGGWVDKRLALLRTAPDVQAVAAKRPYAMSSLILIDGVKDDPQERRELLEAVENRASHSQIKQRIEQRQAEKKLQRNSYRAPDPETAKRTSLHNQTGGGNVSRGRLLTTTTPQDARAVIADAVAEIERHIRTLEAWKAHMPAKQFARAVGPLQAQIEALCE